MFDRLGDPAIIKHRMVFLYLLEHVFNSCEKKSYRTAYCAVISSPKVNDIEMFDRLGDPVIIKHRMVFLYSLEHVFN